MSMARSCTFKTSHANWEIKWQPIIWRWERVSFQIVVYIIYTSENVLYNVQHNVAHLLKARTVEPKKQPLLYNGCVTCNNGVTVERCGPCEGYMSRTDYHYRGVLRWQLEKVRSWCKMAVSLQRCQPRSTGMSTGEDIKDWEDLECAVMNSRMCVNKWQHYSYL
jgi:hypothetical protein